MTGAGLKAWRRARHLSQTTAAQRLGYTQGHWSHMEAGKYPIPPGLQRALAIPAPERPPPLPPNRLNFRRIYGQVGQWRTRTQGWRHIASAPPGIQQAYAQWLEDKRIEPEAPAWLREP